MGVVEPLRIVTNVHHDQPDPFSNRLTQVQDWGGTASITHDGAGNIVADGRNTYAYSDRGRMASATTAGGTVAYVYNGLGQRAKKSGPGAVVPTGASHFVYDEGGQLLGEYDANGYPVYETVYLAATPVGVVKHTGSGATNDLAAAVYNVYADHIDTPRMITAQDHSIVWRWDTAEPFGATGPDENPNGAGRFVYNQRFPGQVFDAETGLFQNWNREYDPRTGRYVQSDPIGLAGGINTFAYVGGNPLAYSDPQGLCVGPLAIACAWAMANSPWLVPLAGEAAAAALAMSSGAMLPTSAVPSAISKMAPVAGAARQAVGEMCSAATEVNAAAKFFEGTRYSERVLGQMKSGDYHGFPRLVENFAAQGSVRTVTQPSTGLPKEMLSIPGAYQGEQGVFEFIKHDSGVIYHRLFNPQR